MYIKGVPTRPNVTVEDITPRSVKVLWNPSLSIIGLSHYTVTLEMYVDIIFEVETQTYDADGYHTSTKFERLKPFTYYRVVVTVYDKAGNKTSSFTELQTLESGEYYNITRYNMLPWLYPSFNPQLLKHHHRLLELMHTIQRRLESHGIHHLITFKTE